MGIQSRLSRIVWSVLAVLSIAAATSPVAMAGTVGAPEYFGAAPCGEDVFQLTLSAPSDVREKIDEGSLATSALAQIDYRLDEGQWHYIAEWDSNPNRQVNIVPVSFRLHMSYVSSGKIALTDLFPGDRDLLSAMRDRGDDGGRYFTDHSVSFRTRFVVANEDKVTFSVSDWSNICVIAKWSPFDPDALISHAPNLLTASVSENSRQELYLHLRVGRLPGEVQYLNALTGGLVATEVWLSPSADASFRLLASVPFQNEYHLLNVSAYSPGATADWGGMHYEVKARFRLDLGAYSQSTRTDTIYSPFSSVIIHEPESWAKASDWALAELRRADDSGLLPDTLRGLDLTEAISRGEFVELAVLLYERTMGRSAPISSPNPFNDTQSTSALKAFSLGITNGTSSTTFSPDLAITREQCAAMLLRALQAINPTGDFDYEGVPDFADQERIEPYAVPAAKFMSRVGIIRGDGMGNFMPKPTAEPDRPLGYGMASREQAIVMVVRAYELGQPQL